MKHLHLLLVALAFFSFVGRLALAEYKPAVLQEKWMKIAPHAIAALLILSGVALVFSGNWLSGDYGWIIAKIMVLLGFIGLGLVAMRSQGLQRWQAAAGAIACFFYIVTAAVSKKIFLFF
jgi:uncharacterized membrane protein SirB2